MTATQRIAAIDITRAITMFLMIFVNDLWSLHDIPKWLEHTAAKDDGMGLADTVFPAFLFIVGMSIPYAISNRIKKGDTLWQLVRHVTERYSPAGNGPFLCERREPECRSYRYATWRMEHYLLHLFHFHLEPIPGKVP